MLQCKFKFYFTCGKPKWLSTQEIKFNLTSKEISKRNYMFCYKREVEFTLSHLKLLFEEMSI